MFECGFCSLICFIVSVYTDMAWNPTEVDYFTLIGNTIITVQYILDEYDKYESKIFIL